MNLTMTLNDLTNIDFSSNSYHLINVGDLSSDDLCAFMRSYYQIVPSSEGELSVVKPTYKGENIDNTKSIHYFEPHLDGMHYKVPPKWVMLYCKNAGYFDVRTFLIDVDDLLADLTSLEKHVLKTVWLRYTSNSLKDVTFDVPVLDKIKGQFTLRDMSRGLKYSIDNSDFQDAYDKVRDLVRNAPKLLNHKWNNGDLLLINNHKLLHGRGYMEGVNSNVLYHDRILYRLWFNEVISDLTTYQTCL